VTHNVNHVLITIPSAHNAKIIYTFWQVVNAFQKLIVKLKQIHFLLSLLIKSILAALALVIANNAQKLKTNAPNAKQMNI